MRICKLTLKNIRCFKKAEIKFSEGINIIVGPNNTGKSTILKSAFLLQNKDELLPSDKRLGKPSGIIKLSLHDEAQKYYQIESPFDFQVEFVKNGRKETIIDKGKIIKSPRIAETEPNNFIYPYLSKRKVVSFQEIIKDEFTTKVTGTLQFLYPKIDRISNPQFLPAYDDYINACDEILGFPVTCTASTAGKKAAYIVKNIEHIPIDVMGDGIVNLLGLIVDLCIAENKLFLIEEPENDVHPQALKSLLKLITKKSKNNQFLITTHSNIVTKYLGAQPESKIFRVKMMFEERLPTSTVNEVGDSPQERREVLEELGYELYDVDLWDGWLFLEESSAEKIIKEYLIPWFVPELQNKLRTFSAHSIDEVEPKFMDFNNLFVFLHLQPSYFNRVWVIVDAGDREKDIIDKMKGIYAQSGWREDQFLQFKEHDFERYYPEQFQEQIEQILNISDKREKRNKKKALLEEVEAWLKDDDGRGKVFLKRSAREVIETLQIIRERLIRG
jgi:AAA15 family ATPase/GTPase